MLREKQDEIYKVPKENENESKEDGMWLLCKYGIQEMPWMETEWK